MSILNFLAERKIREAIDNGDLENLPGEGKPIDLKSYFSMPAETRMAYDLLKNANVLPEEVQLKREIADINHQIEQTVSEAERNLLRKRRQNLQTRLSERLEQNGTVHRASSGT